MNLCDNRRVLGVSCEDYRQHGCFAEYAVVPEHIIYQLPDDLPFEHAAMIEPVSVAVHAVHRTPITEGDTAVVVGAGPILGDETVITITSGACAKATPAGELDSRGRGGIGVRITKLAGGATLTLTRVGQPMGMLAVMASDGDPRKPDPSPVPLMLEPSRRDLVSTPTERQILALGPARW